MAYEKKQREQKKRIKKKKSKGKGISRKPVQKHVQINATANSDGQITVEIDDKGKITCHEAIEGGMTSNSSYQRESGKKKYIIQSTGESKSAHLSQRENICSNYEILAGIDTNDYKFDNKTLSISSAYISKLPLNSKSDNFEVIPLPGFIISNIREGLNSEVVGWHLFFQHILPLLNLSTEKRLGLIVDSELGKHSSINKKEECYYKEHLLPDNVSLIYASSDTGTEAPNKMIKRCDRESRKIFSDIQNGTITLPDQLGGKTEDFSGYVTVNMHQLPLPNF